MAFIGGQDYDRLHIDNGIIDIKGQRATKWIVTKCLRQNTIMTLRGTNTLKLKNVAMEMMTMTSTLMMNTKIQNQMDANLFT
jgi:hypothetical protein